MTFALGGLAFWMSSLSDFFRKHARACDADFWRDHRRGGIALDSLGGFSPIDCKNASAVLLMFPVWACCFAFPFASPCSMCHPLAWVFSLVCFYLSFLNTDRRTPRLAMSVAPRIRATAFA